MVTKEDWEDVKVFSSELRKINGVVYGGVIRDMMAEMNHFSDIDCFIKGSYVSENQAYKLMDDIKSLRGIKRCAWYDSPLDSYGQTYDSLTFTVEFDSGFAPDLNIVYGESLPISTEYLDFDANSLYFDDEEIKSTLGKDRLDKIIKNLKNKEIALMRNSVEPQRIKHMIGKGYKIKYLEFM